MKKFLLAITAIIITSGAYAQSDSTNKKMSPPDIIETKDEMNQIPNQNMDNNQNHHINNMQSKPDSTMSNHSMKNHIDCLMIKDGKMCMMKDGKTTLMKKDMTMRNGTKCMTDGTYIKKDGTKMMMKEGQCMDMNGKIVPEN